MDMFNGAANGGLPAKIAATATAVPPHKLAREEVKRYAQVAFSLEPRRLDALMNIIDNSQVAQRWSVLPVEQLIEPRPLSRITEDYQKHSIELGRRVAAESLHRAGMQASDVDLIITVSCTGFMIPSLDAHLINDLGFRPDVRRLPVTELGCAAGAAGLGRASDFIRAFPGSTALVVAVEIPTLNFQRGNLAQANLISSILFGDGAAAAIVTGREANGAGRQPLPQILDVSSYTFPNSIDAMGFDLKDSGFHIVLSKDVPQMIREKIRGLVVRFLGQHSLCLESVSAFVLHPGGQKLLSYVEQELGLKPEHSRFSWEVLREYGNLSSASVIFVLHEWLSQALLRRGEYGLLAAFGPGFSAEMLLLQWT